MYPNQITTLAEIEEALEAARIDLRMNEEEADYCRRRIRELESRKRQLEAPSADYVRNE